MSESPASSRGRSPFRDAPTDRKTAAEIPDTPQTRAPAYKLAFADDEFLCSPELRPLRLQLELMKPEMILAEKGIESTIVLFGGARIRESAEDAPNEAVGKMAAYYAEARAFAKAMTELSMRSYGKQNVIVTGGGPGVMEAGNRGAADAGGQSIGLNIVLPHEQAPNEYVTPGLCFNFHYFAVRKMHFLLRARAVCVFPGGFGTMDELFECLTLIQTGRMQRVPVLLFGREFWESVVNFEALAKAGTIAPEDLDLFRFVETADEAIAAIENWDGVGTTRDAVPGR
ncbi:putative lysine decarboxylase [Rhodobacteraceae bacterium THAF1]|uniref:LOG family protein n=1 Tax=Palleronia sp. THAF1 TaxID=2587842 RepID=UPI000F40B69D|nr:TIGR00730 family Rossman fold protein [Palleronia sp. THAF1]QFU07273.1 putative lysine decarboxylase [Palleronia sp. THAF1]VDC20815.1 putative lysine decarboxylase [Rhodobacteraceae bacterium THAF1]